MMTAVRAARVDADALRRQIGDSCVGVALMPEAGLRALRPGGCFQPADIVVYREVSRGFKDGIDLWSG